MLPASVIWNKECCAQSPETIKHPGKEGLGRLPPLARFLSLIIKMFASGRSCKGVFGVWEPGRPVSGSYILCQLARGLSTPKFPFCIRESVTHLARLLRSWIMVFICSCYWYFVAIIINDKNDCIGPSNGMHQPALIASCEWMSGSWNNAWLQQTEHL